MDTRRTSLQDQFGRFIGRRSRRVLEMFRYCVTDYQPNDADVMYRLTGTVDEAIELFEVNTQRFVAAQQNG